MTASNDAQRDNWYSEKNSVAGRFWLREKFTPVHVNLDELRSSVLEEWYTESQQIVITCTVCVSTALLQQLNETLVPSLVTHPKLDFKVPLQPKLREL